MAEYRLTYKVDGLCNNYISEIERYEWPVALAVQVFKAESGCNPDAKNSEAHYKDKAKGIVNCYGSFNIPQNSCEHYSKGEDKKDPILAIEKAYKVWVDNGKSFKGKWGVCRSIVKNCS